MKSREGFCFFQNQTLLLVFHNYTPWLIRNLLAFYHLKFDDLNNPLKHKTTLLIWSDTRGPTKANNYRSLFDEFWRMLSVALWDWKTVSLLNKLKDAFSSSLIGPTFTDLSTITIFAKLNRTFSSMFRVVTKNKTKTCKNHKQEKQKNKKEVKERWGEQSRLRWEISAYFEICSTRLTLNMKATN